MNNDIKIPVVQSLDGKYRAVLPEALIPSAPRGKDNISRESSISEWIAWGANDDYPTRSRKLIRKVSIAGSTIRKVANKLAGNGLCYHYRNGAKEPAYIPEVENFLFANQIHTKWWLAQVANYCYYMNTFGTMILSTDRTKIVRLIHKDAETCRVGMNKDRTMVSRLHYSPYFAIGETPAEDKRLSFPLLQLNADDQTFLDRYKSISEVGYHTFFPTPGSFYYGIPWWDALFQTDGWLNVSANVPKIILSMHNNQVSLKYIISIPESYFVARYSNWQLMDESEVKTIVDTKVQSINDLLTGTDNVAKSLSQLVKEDPVTHGVYGKITIEAIDDKLKRDAWVPDATVSDAQIVQGFGEHPSQIGLQPAGGKMGAGSGSDQRESYNTSITLNTPDQQVILEPLNFISRFNGWDVEFYVDHTFHTTTNNAETGLVPAEGSKNKKFE